MTDIYDMRDAGWRGLPVPPITSVSGIRSFADCARRYFFEHVARLEPRSVPSGFAIGRLIHEMLAAYFSKGRDEAAMAKVCDEFRMYGEAAVLVGKSEDDFELALACASGIISAFPAWEQAQRPVLTVMATEWPFHKATSKCGLSGRIDNLGSVDEGHLAGRWVVDHKTHGLGKGDEVVDRTPFDKQARLYCYETGARGIAWTLIGKTAIRRRKDESRDEFCRRAGAEYRTDPGKYFRRKYELLPKPEGVLDEIAGVMAQHGCSRGRYKKLGPAAFPQNEKACFGMGTCPFLSLCRGEAPSLFKIKGDKYGDSDARAALGAPASGGEAGAGDPA